jgi:serine/threonine protein kinase
MAHTAPARTAVALVIGIGSYRLAGGRIRALPCAVHDAEEVAKALTDPAIGSFPASAIKLLRDEEATREEIVTQLSEELRERARGAELTVIYFAGHGMLRPDNPPEGYLIPADWDGQLSKLSAQAIPMRDVARWVSAMQSTAVVLILDCCHAAHVGVRERDAGSESSVRDIRLPPSALRDLPGLRGKGRYWLASCDEDQTSLELDDLQHGLFTYHLLRGLRSEAPADAEGRVGLDSLFDYITRAVTADASRQGKRQTPWRSFEGGGDVYLAFRGQLPIATPGLPPEYGRLEKLWAEEGPVATVAHIESLLDAADENFLLAALRLLAEKADCLGTYSIFRSLPHNSEKVRRYAHKALCDIGWAQLNEAASEIVQQGEPARITALLDGLNALAAHPDPLRLLERLIDLRLPATQQLKAIEIANNKRLRLREEEIAALFREVGSRYDIRRALGQGAITAAYLAYHKVLRREFVVRVLQERYADQLDIRTRFLEVSIWAAGFHEGSVLRTIELEQHFERKIYGTVRDYVEGLTLREVLAEKTCFEPLQSLRILRKLAEALVDVHACAVGNVIRPHGGVKPSNVFLTRDNRVVLGDPGVLVSNELLGTGGRLAYEALYLAPEAFEAQVGPASDLYSLGCVAYELFCGRPPFLADSTMKVLMMHSHNPPIKPSQRGSSAAGRVDEFIMQLLEKDPTRRYASAEAVREAIEELEQLLRWPPRPGDAGGGPARPAAGSDRPPVPSSAAEVSSVGLLDYSRIENQAGRRSGVNLQVSPVMTLKEPANPGRIFSKEADEKRSSASAPASGLDQAFPVGEGYQLLERIGQGQFGEVWRALAPGGVAVAIKRYFRSMDDESSQRELKALHKLRELRHPFLLQMHNFQALEDRLVIVMELADGSLQDRLMECQAAGMPGIPADELLRYFGEAAEAIDFLHQQKLSHRDIKPQNLLHMQGHAKVADFGIARLQEHAVEHTQNIGGTPAYMAPEMWQGDISIHSDQYSFAVTWYEMRTGRRVFSSTNMVALLQQHLSGKPDLSGVPEAEQEVLLRALAKDPNQRFPICVALVQALAVAMGPSKQEILVQGDREARSAGTSARTATWLKRWFRWR